MYCVHVANVFHQNNFTVYHYAWFMCIRSSVCNRKWWWLGELVYWLQNWAIIQDLVQPCSGLIETSGVQSSRVHWYDWLLSYLLTCSMSVRHCSWRKITPSLKSDVDLGEVSAWAYQLNENGINIWSWTSGVWYGFEFIAYLKGCSPQTN